MLDLRRKLLIVAGSLCVALGIIGIFLPVLPTTPFLLLAAACYARSSQRFYRWLLNQKHLGEYIRNYREGRGISLRAKILTVAVLWASIGYSALAAVDSVVVRIILLVTAIGVTIHVVTMPTFRQ